MNLYTYVENNPVNWLDEFGLQASPQLAPVPTPTPGSPLPPLPNAPDNYPGIKPGTGIGAAALQILGRASLILALLTLSGDTPQQPIAPPSPVPNPNPDDGCPKYNDCKDKVSDWWLDKMGIDAHQLKKGILGSRAKISLYELCMCKSGSIVIRLKGCKGPIIPTGY